MENLQRHFTYHLKPSKAFFMKTKEERKRMAAERKTKREANKERYGYAMVDGVRMEIGNYTVEPSSIMA